MLSIATQSFHSELSTQHFVLWLTEWAPPLISGSGLFHGTERPFLVRIIKPSPLPEIAGGRGGRNLRTPVSVEGRTVDPACNVNPVNHGRSVKGERTVVKDFGNNCRSPDSPSRLTPYRLMEGAATHPSR